MSGHGSTYVPKSGFTKWLDSRLPIVRLVSDSFIDFPTPKKPELLVHIWRYSRHLSGHSDRHRDCSGDALYTGCHTGLCVS